MIFFIYTKYLFIQLSVFYKFEHFIVLKMPSLVGRPAYLKKNKAFETY